MSKLYSFEKEHIINKLDLPKHMLVFEYNDLFVFCSCCAEGKVISSHNDKYYDSIHKDLNVSQIKIGEPKFDIAMENISNHFCNKITAFIEKHKKCFASDDEIIFNKYCL